MADARDRHEQIRIFDNPESSMELVKTQARRWLAANRHRLNAEQIAVLEEHISALRAELAGKRRVAAGFSPPSSR